MLADIILKVAEMTHEEDTPFYPRPSSAGPERCIRQMVYHGLNTPKKPLPGRAVMIFSDSSFHEDLTNDWIRKTAFELHSEQMEVGCRGPIGRGHIDGILTDVLKVDRLMEHKAINHFTFQKYWNGELPLDYLTQTAIYIDGLQHTANPDLKEGLLLIKNKNTAQYMEFLVRYENDMLTILEKTHSAGETEKLNIELLNIVEDACNKFDSVLDYIERKTLPKRQYDIDHWRCEYCAYGATCWDGYEQEFTELAVEGMLSNEITDMVRYYKELRGQKSDIEKEYKDLSKKVKNAMKEAGCRQGRAGEYLCKMALIRSERLDKPLLTEKEKAKATKISQYEKLTISKIKEVA